MNSFAAVGGERNCNYIRILRERLRGIEFIFVSSTFVHRNGTSIELFPGTYLHPNIDKDLSQINVSEIVENR